MGPQAVSFVERLSLFGSIHHWRIHCIDMWKITDQNPSCKLITEQFSEVNWGSRLIPPPPLLTVQVRGVRRQPAYTGAAPKMLDLGKCSTFTWNTRLI